MLRVMTVIGRCLPRGYAAVSLNYTDASVIPSWATEQVKTCVSAGVIGGYSDGYHPTERQYHPR